MWGSAAEGEAQGAVALVGGDPCGGDEVDGGQEPHHVVAVGVLGEGGAVGVDAYEAFHAPDSGDEVADGGPEGAHGVAWPCESGEEEEDDGGEDDDHQGHLALFDEELDGHAEECGGDEHRDDEGEVVEGGSDVGQ